MNDLLNPYQKTSLATALRMFEESLRQADSWLDGNLAEGILYRQELHLEPGQRILARKNILAALDEIALLAQEIGLEPTIEDPAKMLRGQMSIAWASLVDSQASKLKRFGEVHPDAAQTIDVRIQRLVQVALELALLFENHSSTPVSPDAENLTEI